MCMGIAEVIPGVSGGTIAFITGIYERLLHAISGIGPELITAYRSGGIGAAWQRLDGYFIVNLMVGMVAGIVVGVFAVEYLLINYPEPLWGFFFGLIIASCLYIGNMVDKWTATRLAALLIGAIVAYGVTTLAPAEGSEALWFVFLSGVIAISALILPGISGSFILLIMGMYHIVIPSIKSFLSHRDMESFSIFAVFAAGALLGLTTFSRVVSYLFARYEHVTLALLTGFMAGSLSKLWPWRNIETIKLDDGASIAITDLVQLQTYNVDDYKVLVELRVLPADYWLGTPKVGLTVVTILVGFAVVFLMHWMGRKESPTA